jgi:hypothetical protein
MAFRRAVASSQWGPAPSRSEIAEMDRLDRVLLTEAAECLADSSVSVPQAAEMMGTSTAEVEVRLARGELLGFTHDGALLLPRWQFAQGTPLRPLVGIQEIRSAFGGNILGLSKWALAPNSQLAGESPRDRLERGDPAAVLAALEAVGHTAP